MRGFFSVPTSRVFHTTTSCFYMRRSLKMQALISVSGLRKCAVCERLDHG